MHFANDACLPDPSVRQVIPADVTACFADPSIPKGTRPTGPLPMPLSTLSPASQSARVQQVPCLPEAHAFVNPVASVGRRRGCKASAGGEAPHRLRPTPLP